MTNKLHLTLTTAVVILMITLALVVTHEPVDTYEGEFYGCWNLRPDLDSFKIGFEDGTNFTFILDNSTLFYDKLFNDDNFTLWAGDMIKITYRDGVILDVELIERFI